MFENKFTSSNHNTGKVYLVGAGPGDPELITVKGKNVLERADVIVYDRLANPELLATGRAKSEHIFVGKKPGSPSVSQEGINKILISKANEGKIVARLKGGDPFVFGRGGEEIEALAAHRVPFEVVPGISSVTAAPAYAGIPLTHRNMGRSFTVVTGHTLTGTYDFENWDHLVFADTLVILMGMRNLARISNKLITSGRTPDTPVSVIEKATYHNQRVVTGTLASIDEITRKKNISSPATIVVGELASMSNDLAWFNPKQTQFVDEYKPEVISGYAG